MKAGKRSCPRALSPVRYLAQEVVVLQLVALVVLLLVGLADVLALVALGRERRGREREARGEGL